MTDIPLDKAGFISLYIQSILYGTYIPLFSICVRILVFKNKQCGSKANRLLMFTAIAMFFMSTVYMCIDFIRGAEAFIGTGDRPGSATGYYRTHTRNWLNTCKHVIWVTNCAVTDGLLVYRCYIVWSFSFWIVLGPIFMMAGTVVAGYGAVYQISQSNPRGNIFATKIVGWVTAGFCLTLATNLVVTTLIAGRIWWITRRVNAVLGSRRQSNKCKNAFIIVVESGVVYAISLAILLILYLRKTNAQYIIFSAIAQIMGIVPTLIIVRVGLGLATQEVYQEEIPSWIGVPNSDVECPPCGASFDHRGTNSFDMHETRSY